MQPVNTNWGPGPVNINWGPKLVNTKWGLGTGNINTPILNTKEEDLSSDEILYPMNVDSQSLGSKLKTSWVTNFVQLLFLTSIYP